MKYKKIYFVYKKEILDILRDKKTLLISVLGPIVLYPLLFVLVMQLTSISINNLENEKSIIALSNNCPIELINAFKKDEKIEIVNKSNPMESLKSGEIHTYVEFNTTLKNSKNNNVNIFYDGAINRSSSANKKAQDAMLDYKRKVQEKTLEEANIDVKLLDIVKIKSENVASSSRMGNVFLGSILPLLIFLSAMISAVYPALDVTVGEKERGTLETILTVPIHKSQLFLGKYLAVFSITVISAFINLLSILLVYSSGLAQMSIGDQNMEVNLSIISILTMFFMVMPLLLLSTALIMSACLFAKSFKDAQNYITPITMILMLPVIFSALPGIELTSTLTLVPILNSTIALKSILLQSLSFQQFLTIFFVNFIFAFFSYLVALKFYNAEEVLFAEGRGFNIFTRRSNIEKTTVLKPSDALTLTAIVFGVLWYIRPFLDDVISLKSIIITQWLGILIPIFLIAWYLKANFKQSFNLNKFKVSWLFATILLVLGTFVINLYVSKMQFWIFPEMETTLKSLEKLIDSQNRELFTSFFIFAITPGICEELLFRGILLSSFKKRFAILQSVVIIAIIFGIFHLDVFRMIPTSIMGAVLTYIVYRTNSIYLSIIGHIVSNGIIVLISFNLNFANKVNELTLDIRTSIILIISSIVAIYLGDLLLKNNSSNN